MQCTLCLWAAHTVGWVSLQVCSLCMPSSSPGWPVSGSRGDASQVAAETSVYWWQEGADLTSTPPRENRHPASFPQLPGRGPMDSENGVSLRGSWSVALPAVTCDMLSWLPSSREKACDSGIVQKGLSVLHSTLFGASVPLHCNTEISQVW